MIPVWLALSLTLSELPQGVEKPDCPEGTEVDVDHHSDSVDLFCFYNKPDAYNCGTEQVRHGPFVSYYVSGKIKSRYQYDEGKASGPYMSWHENGQLKSHGMVIPKPEGWKDPVEWECIQPGYYLDGTGSILDGEWIGYYENGQPRFHEHYEAAYRNGIQTFWYEDGTKQEETEYRNDKKDGLSRQWHPNGNPFFAGSFKKGVPDGDWHYWNTEGGLIAEGAVKNGTGEFKEFEKDGLLAKVVPYENGKIHGEMRVWFLDGLENSNRWKLVTYYEHGISNRQCAYINDEMRWDEQKNDETGIVTKKFFESGRMSQELNWLRGDRHGPFRHWYPSGQLDYEEFYDHDRPVGIWTKYDEDGNIIEQVNHDLDPPETP